MVLLLRRPSVFPSHGDFVFLLAWFVDKILLDTHYRMMQFSSSHNKTEPGVLKQKFDVSNNKATIHVTRFKTQKRVILECFS